MALVAPSLNAADLSRLGEALDAIKAAGASMLHVDVMDGHFVPDIAMGQPVVASLRRATNLALDVHLLIERPERYVAQFIEGGADRVAVHPESTPHFHRVLELIRQHGAKAGAALNPATPVELLEDVLAELDFVTILSTDPGVRGASFIPGSAEKVRCAASARESRRLNFAIQVEGGVGFENLDALLGAGADILVAGSAIFQYDDPKARLIEMIRRASGARQTSRV